jgi:hypothetical protein
MMSTAPSIRAAVAHPLVDEAGPGWVATESVAPLIWLSQARLDLLTRASRQGDRVVVVSGTGSRLTEPMRDTLATLGGRWLVHGLDGVYDGLSGRSVDTVEGLCAAEVASHEMAPAFLRPSPGTELQLIVSWSMRLMADEDTVLGGSLETFLGSLGLGMPSGWGWHEPVSQPWNRDALTQAVRVRMPTPSRLVVIADAGRAVFVVLVQRIRYGVEEIVTGLVGLGPARDAASATAMQAVPAALAAMSVGTMPLFGLVLARAGRHDLTQEPRLPGAPLPVAMMIGPAGVRRLGVDVDTEVARWGAVTVGRKKLPGLVYSLIPRYEGDTGRLGGIVAGFDQEKMRVVFGSSSVLLSGGM